MAVRKVPDADLRLKYPRVFELSLIIALGVMIISFRFIPIYGEKSGPLKYEQELVQVEDIENTRQENRPPPPPRPPIPIEAPSDEVLDDIDIIDTELDITADVAPPPSDFDEETYFLAVEDMPDIIGGLESIQRNVIYPDLAIRAGVEGTVYVTAFVDEKGIVTKTEIAKGIGAGCDEAASWAVSKARFIPGKQRGKPVKVRVSIPIRFRIK
ncbi:MAG: energy transducer TonB [Bacteroidota bacterium]